VKRHLFASAAASILVGAALIALLIARSGLNPARIGQLLLGANAIACAAVTMLIGLNAFLASEKWRQVDRHLGGAGRRSMPRRMYFALTAIGTGLGQILPVPLALAVSRSLGAHVHGGRALLRGTGGTIFEQFFDVATAGFLGLASAVLIAIRGGAYDWLVAAPTAIAAGFFLTGLAAPLAARVCGRLAAHPAIPGARLRELLSRAAGSPLLAPPLACRLLAISLLRFAVLVLVGVASAKAASFKIPAWELAAAIPLGVLANTVPITPGGLGVNEWAMSSALVVFGTPFQVAAQWAIMNRVLVALASILCGSVGLLAAVSSRRLETPLGQGAGGAGERRSAAARGELLSGPDPRPAPRRPC
jgi:uncharacterized membrane protein YbhN (UPF0104 family)